MRCQLCNGKLILVEQDDARSEYECRSCRAGYEWSEIPAEQRDMARGRSDEMLVIDDLWSQS
jgi:hypothetical protein